VRHGELEIRFSLAVQQTRKRRGRFFGKGDEMKKGLSLRELAKNRTQEIGQATIE
jgi:hypothetical protein